MVCSCPEDTVQMESRYLKLRRHGLNLPDRVLGSVLKARDSLGVDCYNREWGHPFPKEACDKLGRAIHESDSGG